MFSEMVENLEDLQVRRCLWQYLKPKVKAINQKIFVRLTKPYDTRNKNDTVKCWCEELYLCSSDCKYERRNCKTIKNFQNTENDKEIDLIYKRNPILRQTSQPLRSPLLSLPYEQVGATRPGIFQSNVLLKYFCKVLLTQM